MESEKSNMGNLEWALIIGAFIIIDICQWILDLIPVVGEIINALLDVVIAFAFAFYLYMRGTVSFSMIFTMAVGFLIKEGTLSITPWTIEALIIFGLKKLAETKAFQKIAGAAGKVSGGSKLVGSVVKYVAPEAAGALNAVNKVSDRAEKIQQAANSVQRNQLKFSGQNFSNASVRSGTSPRAAQIAQASGAVLKNQQKINVSTETQKNAVRQQAQEERGNIALSALNNGLNLVPFVGGGKMMLEAIAGKELGGKKMSGRERIIHAAVGASSAALDIFGGAGDLERGAFLAGRSTELIENIGGSLAEKGAAKSGRVFTRTAKFMADHPEVTDRTEHYADGKIKEKIKEMQKYREGERPQYENRT